VSELVLHDVEVAAHRVDVVVRDGHVAAIRPPGQPVVAGVDVVEGHGAALIPGLHDHHLHLAATAADRVSVRVGPDDVTDAAGMALALRVAADRLGPGRWLRATGYHEQVAGDLDRDGLDRMVGDRPTRVQHRTGAMWILNSAAVTAARLDGAGESGIERDADGRPTGRVFGADAWLRGRVGPTEGVDLAAVGAELAGYGVTGVTDATPTESIDDLRWLADAVERGDLPQLVVVTGGAALAEMDPPDRLELGPVKLVVADHALPSVDDLGRAIARAHATGRAVAVHCVTHLATVVALAAWDEAGSRPGDRIEHGSVVTPEVAALIAGHGLTVVTQPSFVFERGDEYQRDVDPIDRPWLYRCRGLEEAGVAVGGSTDAPYGSLDPWRAMAAAVTRRTRSGASIGPDEAVSPARALALFLGPADRPGGPPAQVEVGATADLCLLDAPLADVLAQLDARHVRLTLRRGDAIFER
jgi:predicted amidohydrolase YtcJ